MNYSFCQCGTIFLWKNIGIGSSRGCETKETASTGLGGSPLVLLISLDFFKVRNFMRLWSLKLYFQDLCVTPLCPLNSPPLRWGEGLTPFYCPRIEDSFFWGVEDKYVDTSFWNNSGFSTLASANSFSSGVTLTFCERVIPVSAMNHLCVNIGWVSGSDAMRDMVCSYGAG